MRADGTRHERLTATRIDDTHPTWAPDGQRIAFKRADDIYVMKADGTSAHPISHAMGSDGDPAWSPDGNSDRVHSTLVGHTGTEIWIHATRRLGSEALDVAAPARASTRRGRPTDHQIVFASNIVGSLYDLYLVDVMSNVYTA